MPYCYDCSKITGYDEPQHEITQAEANGTELFIGVRVFVTCADCSSEKKDYEFEFMPDPEHACPKLEEGVLPEYELNESDINVELGERYQTTTTNRKTGKVTPIKNSRYQKKFYTCAISGTVRCTHCDADIEFDESDEVQASGMNEI